MISLAFGLFAIILTAIVTLYAAKKEEIPRKYLGMLWAATLATVATTVASWAEQDTFEKWVVGGDGYVFVTFQDPAQPARFMLRNASNDYPIYDLNLEFYDVRAMLGNRTKDWESLLQKIERSVLGPGKFVFMTNNFPTTDCYGLWAALVTQRNRDVLNVIQARQISGKWETATRVYTADATLDLLKEYASAGWDRAAEWPIVKYDWPARFSYRYETVSCPPTEETAAH